MKMRWVRRLFFFLFIPVLSGLFLPSLTARAGLGYYRGAWGNQGVLDLIDESTPEKPAFYRGPWDVEAKTHPLFVKAEKELGKKNFRRAERGYARFIKKAPKHIDVPRATFQRARALLRLSSFDESLKLLEDFLGARPGLLWEARCRTVLSELFAKMPQYAFRRGRKLHYNREHREGQQVYTWAYNRHRILRELEKARLAYLEVMDRTSADAGDKADADLFRETVDHDLALAQALQARGGKLWDATPPTADIQPPADGAVYDFSWPERSKVIFLTEEAERLSLAKIRARLAAEARFQKIVFLMRYSEAPPVPWQKKSTERLEKCNQARKSGDPVCLADVFDAGPRLDALRLVDSLLRDFPEDDRVDRALGTRGRVLEGRHRFVAAEKTYEDLLEKHPKSKYTGDARQSLYALRRAWFSLTANSVIPAGKERKLSYTARNLKSIAFQAYEVDLAKAMARSGMLNNARKRFADFAGNFGGTKKARKWFGRKVATWHVEPDDRGDHVQTMGETMAPVTETGAYLVLGRGGKEEHVALLVLTDLVLVGKQDRGQAHYWVTDARTGQPVPGVDVIVKEVYWLNSSERVRIGRYKSDKSGLVTHRLVKFRHASSSNVQAFAHDGKRYAFSQTQHCYSRGRGKAYDQNRIFSITDRPVYRPGDVVRFKHIVRGYHQGKNKNVPGVRLRVTVNTPRGEILYDQTHKTDAYGTLHGEVKLDAEATLGAYRVGAYVEQGYGSYQSSGSTFRVEEYKKPEFKVSVIPATPDARPGTAVRAEVLARYYFGAPVAHARVKYQVYRQVYWHSHFRPSRWDWLFGSGYGLVHERPFQQGTNQELVFEGTGQTGETGKLEIELPPAEKDTKHDFLYTVQAQVTDLSRRTIQGKGDVKVTRDPFHIFTHTRRGFFSPRDHVEVEVEALTPQDKPVEASGTWTAYHLTYPIGEGEKAEELARHPIATDAAGRAFLHWTAPEVGHYRIRVKLRRGSGPVVEHDRNLYVAGDAFDPGRFRFQKITLRTEKRTYARGETIRLMLGAPRPGAALWITHEGADEIFSGEVMRLEGTGTVLTIPADETRAPNFFVRVVMVDGGEVFFEQREIFIPPGEEILDVALTPDAATRTPGQKGKFKIVVKDHRGIPVQGQLCLSVFDESVTYIQGDTTGDIRKYYYGDRRYLSLWVQNSIQSWHLGAHWSPKPPKFKLGGLPHATAGWHLVDMTDLGGTWAGWGRGGGGYYAANGKLGAGSYRAQLMSRASAGPVVTGALAESTVLGGELDGLVSKDSGNRRGREGQDAGAAMAAISVREFFADTALWLPALETNEAGEAVAELTYPDSVTTWQGRVFVVDAGRKVGMARARVVTTKNLVARIETPRFLTEGDRVTLAAVIHNGFDHPVDVRVRLHTDGLELDSTPELALTIPAHTDMRHDFAAVARVPGQATVRLTAASREESDALKKTLPVLAWGAEKLVATSDTRKKPGAIRLKLDLPAERRPGSARLTIEAAPSMGGVLLRALPYLLRYPYGCVEQTISRFVPAAVVARTLREAGVSLERLKPVRGKADIQDHLGKLPWYAAIRSSGELDAIIGIGISRIASMQNGDGGFGWFSGFDSSPYMTAYAVLGLTEATKAGYRVDPGMLSRAVNYLVSLEEDVKGTHLGLFVAYVTGLQGRHLPTLLKGAYSVRDKFSPYGQALLALGLFGADLKKKARMVADNLLDLAWVDENNNTATFKPPPSRWWVWWFNRVETTAWALRAALVVRPDHPHVDRMARWLTRNRSGNRWTSTRDTSMAILALTRYMKKRGELNPDATIAVYVNDRKVKSFRATRRSVLGLDGTLVLPDEALAAGPVDVRIELEGRGVVYASAFLEYFTKEERITGAGYEIAVQRSYHKLTPVARKTRTWRGDIQVRDHQRSPLSAGDSVASGDLVEVRLQIDSKNDYSHLVFEDFKPAGFEATELKSGCRFENGAWQYRELRDERVVHFLSSLPQGTQVLTYRLRAEIPGRFRVLPHKAQAMYAPRIRAISDSSAFSITD